MGSLVVGVGEGRMLMLGSGSSDRMSYGSRPSANIGSCQSSDSSRLRTGMVGSRRILRGVEDLVRNRQPIIRAWLYRGVVDNGDCVGFGPRLSSGLGTKVGSPGPDCVTSPNSLLTYIFNTIVAQLECRGEAV